MKKILFLIIGVLFNLSSIAQVTCSATAGSGSGYTPFTDAGFGIENPDCEHTTFGAHITQVFDNTIQRNVFQFHSHIDADNDRCQVFDRVRMEVKGGPNTDLELQHPLNSIAYYRWKFRINEDYVSGSSFHHIFQLKAKGGNDDSFPVLTITLRTSKLEVSHNGGDTGIDLGTLADADLSLFKGRWIEAFIKVNNQENGEFEVELKDLLNENILLQYSNNDIDLWRTDADYNRPKWGMYRSKNASLEDEIFQFADFCISETSEDLCSADTTTFVDSVAPSIPLNLMANNVMISSLDLTWEESTDDFGVTAYRVFQDGSQVYEGAANQVTLDNLMGSMTYGFTVSAIDAAGNISPTSDELQVTTDDVNALPSAASNPFPNDGSEILDTNPTLSWTKGENTDSTKIYIGTSATPMGFENVDEDFYMVSLNAGTQYFWQIIHENSNGSTASPVWSFTTSSGNPDAPWLVYRANERLDIETSFLTALDIPATPTLDEVTDDPNGSTNNFYHYRHQEEEKFRWRQELNLSDTAITVVARLKALNEDVNCICYFEIKAFGWREKLRLNQSTIKLERSNPIVEEDIPFEFKDAFHLIRVTMEGNIMKVYLDENPIPVAIGNSVDDDTTNRFEWGKAGSPDCGASIDWMAIINNQANAPDEGAALPSDLFLSSVATLSDLQIDGTTILNFSPSTFDYTFDVGNSTMTPSVSFTTVSDLATSNLVTPSAVPNTSAMVEVTAQDGFTNNIYTVNFVGSVSVENDFEKYGIKIYPNPAANELFIDTKFNDLKSIEIFNTIGVRFFQNNLENISKIDTQTFPTGIYFIFIKKENGQIFKHKFLIEK